MSKPNPIVTKPIHTRVTFRDGEDPSIERTVFCHRHGHLVPIDACASCAYAVSVPRHAAGATVVCRAPHDAGSCEGADLGARAAHTPLDELLRRSFACARGDAGWDTLEGLLRDDGVGVVPVVDPEGRPIGIVSKSDMMRHARDGIEERETGRGILGERGLHLDARAQTTAARVMTPLVHTLPEGAPLSSAIALFALESIDEIPVVSAGVPSSVCSRCAMSFVGWLGRWVAWSDETQTYNRRPHANEPGDIERPWPRGVQACALHRGEECPLDPNHTVQTNNVAATNRRVQSDRGGERRREPRQRPARTERNAPRRRPTLARPTRPASDLRENRAARAQIARSRIRASTSPSSCARTRPHRGFARLGPVRTEREEGAPPTDDRMPRPRSYRLPNDESEAPWIR